MFNPELFAKLKARTVVDGDGCWVWQGPRRYDPRWKNGAGCYGAANLWNKETRKQRSLSAHRTMWYAVHGQLFNGRTHFVCHTCDKGLCINPDHLYVGTPQDNMTDAVTRRRFPQQQRTHCPAGHEYTPENTSLVSNYRASGNLKRHCRRCKIIKGRVRAGWPRDLAESMPTLSPRSAKPRIGKWPRTASPTPTVQERK